MNRSLRSSLVATGLAVAMMVSTQQSFAFQDQVTTHVQENPSGGAMIADAVLARPLLLGATAVGTALFVVSLPASLLGGNVGQAADALVKAPAEATFVRCLGCTTSGRSSSDDALRARSRNNGDESSLDVQRRRAR